MCKRYSRVEAGVNESGLHTVCKESVTFSAEYNLFFVARRISIALLLLAFFWVGEPAYALWNFAADHACCLPKSEVAEPSCHEMAHHSAAGASVAAGHNHSDCAHDCCTKQRTANSSTITGGAIALRSTRSTEIVVQVNAEIRANARWSSLSERGPPTLS
jgi:hypothetical protein